jgi:hypothetical protein
VPRARSSVLGRQPVAHERRHRGVIFGVDGGLADGAGLAGGGRIDGTAGEVDAAPACGLPVAAVRRLRKASK